MELFETELISKAKGRLEYTYNNLQLLKTVDKKVFFVRWIRNGHPDAQLPYAFESENIVTVSHVIANFLGHENFQVLHVQSNVVHGKLSDDEIIVAYNRDKFGVTAIINERQGFDGDGTFNFKGDTVSWNKLLSKFVTEECVDGIRSCYVAHNDG